MAYENGYKDGYSSADHATEDFSPYGWERAQRMADGERSERQRFMSQHQANLEKERRYNAMLEAERERKEWERREEDRASQERIAQRKKAINILVQQKRDEYNKKNLFIKAIASMRGKSFDKMRRQIIAETEKNVRNMSQTQIERIINQEEKRTGRSK